MLFSLVVVLAVVFSITSEASLNAKLWQSADGNFVNAGDFPESSLLASRPNTAIGFTGGGARAYTAAIGQLAALNELGLIPNIRYIGGISGGAWATTTFSYSQRKVDDSVLLGKVLQPSELTVQRLREMDPNCIRGLTDADLIKTGYEAWHNKTVAGVSDAWAYGVSKVYLEPVGINPNVRFSWSTDVVDEIKKRNPSLVSESFILPTNSNRPYPIIGTTLVGPTEGAPYKLDAQNYSMIEFTPLYAGQMKSQVITYQYSGIFGRKHEIHVGGAVEPFAYSRVGTPPTVALSAGTTAASMSVPEPETYLDLAYAAGASSYAPGSFFESYPLLPQDSFGLPMDYWSPSDRLPTKKNWLFADGGVFENIPLISYLQRKVSKIILFINCEQPLAPADKWNVRVDPPASNQITDALSAFFGVLPSGEAKWQNRSYEYEMDQVFAKSDYYDLVEALQAAQAAGNGIIVTKRLTTIQNNFWGIPAGFTAEITFDYLGRLQGWEKQLSPDMYPLLVPKDNASDLSVDISDGQFRKFPHYATSGSLVNHERANALADLTGWAVLQNADLFRSVLS